jgi:predicted Rossmann fold flavoprotein
MIAIIGGGAAGFMSAISAARTLNEKGITNIEVVILERMDREGKKILATGNGRCNISNINASAKYYHSKNLNFVQTILNEFTSKDTINFFERIGVLCKLEQDGRVYPYGNQAAGVLDVLRMEAEKLGVQEICNYEVKSIKKQSNNFIITEKSGKTQLASKVIIATGGKAAPNLGSNGSGYDLLKNHTLVETFPALVQVKSSNTVVKGLNGIKVDAIASVVKDGKVLKAEKGEILFTDYGLSGIAIFQLSRLIGEHFTNKNTKANGINIVLDIMPDFNEEELINIIEARVKNQGFKSLESFFTGMLNKRVGQMLIKAAEVTPLSRLANSLSHKEIISIAKKLKAWEFPITGTMDFSNAQVTAGGICVDEFVAQTLESNKIPGLYAVGEVLDVDGDCGGFNLQWAWSTGYIAGRAAAISKKLT